MLNILSPDLRVFRALETSLPLLRRFQDLRSTEEIESHLPKSLSVNNLFLSAQNSMLFPGGGYGAVPLMGSVRRVLEARGAVHSQTREGTSKAVPEKAWGWSQTHVGAIGV